MLHPPQRGKQMEKGSKQKRLVCFSKCSSKTVNRMQKNPVCTFFYWIVKEKGCAMIEFAYSGTHTGKPKLRHQGPLNLLSFMPRHGW